MSFVAGFATGEAFEKKRLLHRLRDYMQRHGITILDRDGQPVAIETLIAAAFRGQMSKTWRVIIGGVSLLALLGVGLLTLLL